MEKRDITYSELLAYLEHALAPEAMRAVQERLALDPELAAAFQRLRDQEVDLFDLGEELRTVAPSVSVRDAVLRRVEARKSVEPPDIEQELLALGQALRAESPRVAITDVVMAHVTHEPQAADVHHLEQELYNVGAEIRGRAPRVKVVEHVISGVVAEKSRDSISLSAYNREKALRRRQSPLSWRVIGAAAACLVIGLAVLALHMAQPTSTSPINIARRASDAAIPAAREDAGRPPVQREGEALHFEHAPAGAAISLLSDVTRPSMAMEGEDEEDMEAQTVRSAPSIEDILAARRDALGGQSEALALLARWGALDPDEVRRLFNEGQLTSAELAGLSRFLPEDEALALLQAAVARDPEDAALRYALARQLMEDPARYAEALDQLAMFKALAPDNSLPYYMDAQILLAQGDYSGALQLLEYAGAFGTAGTFALEAAQFHSAALLAAGLPPDAARMLAAFNAGGNEYATVTQLSHDLLSYGVFFEDMGDYDTAMAIYKSVYQLGLQVNQGALFTNEQLAGLDVQMAAIEAINALSIVVNNPAMVPFLDNAYGIFVESLDMFLANTNLLENLLAGSDIGVILRVIRHIMQAGELDALPKLLQAY